VTQESKRRRPLTSALLRTAALSQLTSRRAHRACPPMRDPAGEGLGATVG
jgi:hypothetical protein